MTDGFSFTGAFCIYSDYFVVPSVEDELAEDTIDHAAVFLYDDEDWSQHNFKKSVCGSWYIKDPDALLVTVAVDGTVYYFTHDEDELEAEIDSSDEGPSDLATLRCGAVIEGRIVVAGMLRQVYMREPGGRWIRMDDGMLADAATIEDAVGILAIEGRSLADIFAVGYGGEIWHFDGSAWQDQTSPTNVVLSDLAYAEDGRVYVVGQLGTLLVGSAGEWRVIEHDATEEDFWGVAAFRGQVFIASDTALWRLEGEELVKVTIDENEASFAKFAGNDEILWSVGEKHIFQTEDGETWEEVDGP